jgi:hypothetical protein
MSLARSLRREAARLRRLAARLEARAEEAETTPEDSPPVQLAPPPPNDLDRQRAANVEEQLRRRGFVGRAGA